MHGLSNVYLNIPKIRKNIQHDFNCKYFAPLESVLNYHALVEKQIKGLSIHGVNSADLNGPGDWRRKIRLVEEIFGIDKRKRF